MNNIYKICLFIALFIASASIAWAGFNYSSANNNFLVDSVLKIGGNYVLVGEALSGYCEDSTYINQLQCELGGSTWNELLSKVNTEGNVTESDSFFAISNNLIFLTPNSRFVSGVRTMSKKEFSTNAITISSSNKNLEIKPQSGKGTLSLQANKILLLNNLKSNEGVSFLDHENLNISNNAIYVEQVVADELIFFGDGTLTIPTDTTLKVSPGGTASADSITIGIGDNNEKDYCVKIDLTPVHERNLTNAVADGNTNGVSWAVFLGDQPYPSSRACDADGGTAPLSSIGGGRYTHKTCCPKDYYIFDFDVESALYCCQIGSAPNL